MPFRSRAPREPISIIYDGDVFVAEKGEAAAASLVATGTLALARSPKFHRPRGPACMRGACDGCLARVDGEPNVMTCMVAAYDGMAIDSQNTLGSKDVDFLRVTDWFFPQGMNHHELLAGIPGAQSVMQSFARRVAGLGRLPSADRPPRPAGRRTVDALVVGCGPAGMAVAAALAARGRSVEVVDDAIRPGGGLRALGPGRAAWADIDRRFADLVEKGAIRVRPSTVAAGVFGDDLLIVDSAGAEVVTAEDVVLATGAHDGVALFEGNDLPGVMSARAAALLLAEGVVVGKRVGVVRRPPGRRAEGEGGFGQAFTKAADGLCEIVPLEAVNRARGTSAVRGVVAVEGGRERSLRLDALLTDEPRSSAFELCVQAGAKVTHETNGFVVRTEGGRVRESFWAVGEVVGTAFEPGAISAEALRVADAIARRAP
jgi:sarcosine oxidase, subunit alpha